MKNIQMNMTTFNPAPVPQMPSVQGLPLMTPVNTQVSFSATFDISDEAIDFANFMLIYIKEFKGRNHVKIYDCDDEAINNA